MEFAFRAAVPAPVEQVWLVVADIPVVALCIPGVVRVEPAEGGRYRGALKVKVGPVALELGGLVTVEELDAQTWRLRFLGEARDRRVPGQVRSRTLLRLQPEAADITTLIVESETHILGKLGEFGQSIIRKKTEQVLAEFTENLKRRLAGDGAPP